MRVKVRTGKEHFIAWTDWTNMLPSMYELVSWDQKDTSLWWSCLWCLTLRGRLYRRRYQLVFFKTSAKDIKNTPSILVVQISVIHQLKLWSVYFFCVHSRIQQNFVVLEKKKENKQDALFVFSISASCSSKNVTKMKCNSAKTQHTDMGVISIESWKCLLWNEVSLIETNILWWSNPYETNTMFSLSRLTHYF